jgi:hypothetical protein
MAAVSKGDGEHVLALLTIIISVGKMMPLAT